MTSYDVKALFTSVPMDPSINIVKQKLQQDPLITQRSYMSIPQIVTLLEFCLRKTYFLFQGKYYEQVHDAAMGSHISPLITNLFMEEFEGHQLCLTAPHLWLRFVDDTFVIQQAKQSKITATHQFTGSTYTVYHRGTTPRRSPTFPGHSGFYRSQPHFCHYSLQTTYTHQSIPTLGQQSFHHSQKQCLQYFSI